MNHSDYIAGINSLRDSAEARAVEAYVAATVRQVNNAADEYANGGVVLLDNEVLSRTVRDVYSDSFGVFSRYTYNWLTSRKAEMDEETRRRVTVILINFFFANLQLLVAQMSRTTRVDIFAIVQAGVEQGKSNVDIAKDIRRAAPNLARSRAPARARTSVVQAGNMGSQAAAREAGAPTKTWWTTLDERTRRGERGFDHAAAHMQTVPVPNPFIVSGEQLAYPGDTTLGASAGNVVNCRCIPLFQL